MSEAIVGCPAASSVGSRVEPRELRVTSELKQWSRGFVYVSVQPFNLRDSRATFYGSQCNAGPFTGIRHKTKKTENTLGGNFMGSSTAKYLSILCTGNTE